jgi:hypothetical protein
MLLEPTGGVKNAELDISKQDGRRGSNRIV